MMCSNLIYITTAKLDIISITYNVSACSDQTFNERFNNCSFPFQDPLYRRRTVEHETSTTHYMSLKLYGDTQRASIMDPLTATGQVRKYYIF